MKTRTETETISANFTGLSRQRVTYRETLLMARGETKHKLRIKIESDSYSFQSGARVERWDGNQWHPVHFMGGDPMKTKLAYSESPKPTDVQADRKELLRVATAILF